VTFHPPSRVAALLLAVSMVPACDHTAPHSVVISGPVHVYPSSTPPATYPGTNFVAELGPSDHPQVLETTSGNGYRAAKVRLADGREGWVFSGEAVEIK
jgi:hypothetical protein